MSGGERAVANTGYAGDHGRAEAATVAWAISSRTRDRDYDWLFPDDPYLLAVEE